MFVFNPTFNNLPNMLALLPLSFPGSAACKRLASSGSASSHYDAAYFAWQHKASLSNALWQTKQLAANFPVDWDKLSKEQGAVLEIGCSTGATISQQFFGNASRFCLEVNPLAVRYQREHFPQINGTTDWLKLPPRAADAAYSFDSFEHHPSPLDSLSCLRTKMKRGGAVFIQVPFEHAGFGNSQAHAYGRRWYPKDKHFHLFTWNPMNLGNLLTAAGFHVHRCTDLNQQHDELRRAGRLEAGTPGCPTSTAGLTRPACPHPWSQEPDVEAQRRRAPSGAMRRNKGKGMCS